MEYHALLCVVLLILYAGILVGDIDAIATNDHLIMVLIFNLIHLHLLADCVSQHTSGQSTNTKTRRNIEPAVIARGSNALVNTWIAHLMLLRLILTLRL